MIAFTPSPLTSAEDADLRAWLAKSGAHLMKKVIDSRMDKSLCEALLPSLEAAEYPAKMDAVSAKLKEAHRYSIFLSVWAELINHPGDKPFEILKLKQ